MEAREKRVDGILMMMIIMCVCVCVGVYLVKQVLKSKHKIRLLDYELVSEPIQTIRSYMCI